MLIALVVTAPVFSIFLPAKSRRDLMGWAIVSLALQTASFGLFNRWF
jgi:hypothetical protein